MTTMSIQKENSNVIVGVIIVLVGVLLFLYMPKDNKIKPPNPTPIPTPEPEPEPDPPAPTVAKYIEVKTEQEFRQAVKDNPNRAVLISGDWCPTCRHFARTGEIEKIRKAFPRLTIIKADLATQELQPIARIFNREENNGTIKKFSAKSTVKAFPSFVVRNNVLTYPEINVTNIRKVLE